MIGGKSRVREDLLESLRGVGGGALRQSLQQGHGP